MPSTDPATRALSVRRVSHGAETRADDDVIVEEPLEIRVAGDTIAVTMRTPGHERDLALGFLFSEGLLERADDVSSANFCGRLGDPALHNTIDVRPRPGGALERAPRELSRRGTLTTSACGVCGRGQIDDLLARVTPLASTCEITGAVLASAVRALRDHQVLFRGTGGCHGAALFDADGAHVVTREDVGRHNAVDKLVGAMLVAGALPLDRHMLVVSGRASFEIVQKAACAGIPIVASVSAPSSLAVSLAERVGVTLVAFVRDESFNVYTHASRVTT